MQENKLKQIVTFGDCGYSVYPIGTPVKFNGEIQRVSGIYITAKGDILYTIGDSNQWYSNRDIEMCVLFEVANSITIKS